MRNKILLCILLGTIILVSSCTTETKNNMTEELKDNLTESECLTDNDCAVGGCSGQICGVKEVVENIYTTCEWKLEYGCLKITSCSCINDKCMWEETKEYLDCLANIKQNEIVV